MESVRVEVDCTAGFTAIYTVPVGKSLVVSSLHVRSDLIPALWQIKEQSSAMYFYFWWVTNSRVNDQQWFIFRAWETIEVTTSQVGVVKEAMLCGELVTQTN
jgi:hypothetical protein